ncbi:MAG TPA: site-specific DNA-methyltransferase, partial [Planctomycetaceae bacterium]|nr:site-specific DNA-methyltransferase [Planctomycetaceae bacterium]
NKRNDYPVSPLSDTIRLGDCGALLRELPAGSVDLVFTSPPYFNAKSYSAYESYASYLADMRRIIRLCRRVLAEGRFFVLNSSPVLVARRRRGESSRRLAIP